MTDGLSDSRREAAIQQKFDHALALIEEVFDDGGADPLFGINARLVRSLNSTLHKRGYEVRQLIVCGKAS